MTNHLIPELLHIFLLQSNSYFKKQQQQQQTMITRITIPCFFFVSAVPGVILLSLRL